MYMYSYISMDFLTSICNNFQSSGEGKGLECHHFLLKKNSPVTVPQRTTNEK